MTNTNLQDDDQRQLPYDVAFDLLSNSRRRFVLRRLQDTQDGIELSDLAVDLAAMENGVPAEELSSQDRKRIYVSLYQTHVPKLEDHSVIRYESDAGIIYPTDRVDELATYFESRSNTGAWDLVYLAVSVVGLALYAAAPAVDLPMVGAASVGFGALAAIAVLSLAHYLYTERSAAGAASIAVDGE